MREPKVTRSTPARSSSNPEYIIQIFVAGQTAKSRQAARNLKAICDEGFPGRYKIEIVDISKDPKLAVEHNVIAVPTVIRALRERIAAEDRSNFQPKALGYQPIFTGIFSSRAW